MFIPVRLVRIFMVNGRLNFDTTVEHGFVDVIATAFARYQIAFVDQLDTPAPPYCAQFPGVLPALGMTARVFLMAIYRQGLRTQSFRVTGVGN